jgi:transcriptional regulator with XRE-family HTH domain
MSIENSEKVKFVEERRKMFYDKLKKELEQRNLNLNKLAKACGINQSATSRYKTGAMPNTEVLVKICKYLNVSADYLLDLDDAPPPPNLSDQEQELLAAFRECDSGSRNTVLIQIKAIADNQKQKETSLNTEKVG